MMSLRKLMRQSTGPMLLALLVMACAAPGAVPLATSTPLPPTAEPPTASETSVLPAAAATSAPPTATATPFPQTASPAPEQPAASPTVAFTPVTSAEQILGVWRSGGYYLRFDRDGTFRQARALSRLDWGPYAICSYQFDGASVAIETVDVAGVPPCWHIMGTYELRLLEDGSLRVSAIADECGARAGDFGGLWLAEPTSPTPAPTLEPQAAVILAWHEAWNNKDIDAFMALLAEDAVLDRGPHGLIQGTEDIRAVVIDEMKE